jgi:hypothetical protein
MRQKTKTTDGKLVVKSNVRAGGFTTSPGGRYLNHNARRLVVKSKVRAGALNMT